MEALTYREGRLFITIMNNNIVSILPGDVLLGRGPLRYLHPGNVVFRELVRSLAIHYDVEAPSAKKILIVQHIFGIVLKKGGRFLYQDPPQSGKWNECPATVAIKKIKHALRDARLLINKRDRKEFQKMLLESSIYQQQFENFLLIPEPIREPIVTENPEWRTVTDYLPIQYLGLPRREIDGLEIPTMEDEIDFSEINEWDSEREQFPLIDSHVCEVGTESTTLNAESSLEDTVNSDALFALCIKWLAHAK